MIIIIIDYYHDYVYNDMLIVITDCEEMMNDIVIEEKTVETEDMTWVTGQNDTPRDEMPPGN